MGRDKARLPFRGGDLAEAVAAVVARAAGSVTVVGHAELPGIPDRYPGEGPLGGILTALDHTSADWNLVVACDMPEVSAVFLGELLAQATRSPAAAVIPHGPDGLDQPLCAVYHRRALATMEERFRRGVRKVTAALGDLAVERFAVAELSVFQNVNTPEDWAEYAAK
jgi:molybdopterin-guanine dinucleotide biosynthesis protein A